VAPGPEVARQLEHERVPSDQEHDSGKGRDGAEHAEQSGEGEGSAEGRCSRLRWSSDAQMTNSGADEPSADERHESIDSEVDSDGIEGANHPFRRIGAPCFGFRATSQT